MPAHVETSARQVARLAERARQRASVGHPDEGLRLRREARQLAAETLARLERIEVDLWASLRGMDEADAGAVHGPAYRSTREPDA